MLHFSSCVHRRMCVLDRATLMDLVVAAGRAAGGDFASLKSVVVRTESQNVT